MIYKQNLAMKRHFCLLFCICLCFNVAAQNQQKDWARFYRYEEANKNITTRPKAIFFGDSITDRWVKEDAGFFDENNFVGRGISGQVTSQMLVRFRRDVIELYPKYVVILAGTNDIALNNGPISLENILGNLKSMCELAKVHKIKPVLCSVLPADKYKWRKELEPAEDIVKLNEMIREYARSTRIPFVDYHTALKNENGGLPAELAPDGVHPNLDCYKIMEDIILKVLCIR